MKRLSFFLSFAFAISMFAQQSRMDSLLQKYAGAKDDTSRINYLSLISGELFRRNLDSALTIVLQIKDIAEKNLSKSQPAKLRKFYEEQQAVAFANLGYSYKQKGDYKTAMDFTLKSVEMNRKLNNKSALCSALNGLAILYDIKGDKAKTIECFKESLTIREQIGDKNGVVQSLNNLAYIYYSQGEVIRAMESFSKCLKAYEDLGDKHGEAVCRVNIADIYRVQSDESKALEHLNKALKLEEEIGNKSGVIASYIGIANVYSSYDPDKAVEVYRKAIELNNELGDKAREGMLLMNLGAVTLKANKVDESMSYLERALKIHEEKGDKRGISFNLYCLANGCILKGNLPKAQEYAEGALKISKELGYPESIRAAAEVSYKVYKKMMLGEKALEMYKLFIMMRDSVTNQEIQRASVRQAFKYEYEKKAAADSVKVIEEKKVVAAKLRNEKNQRYALYFGMGIVLVFAGIMFNRFKVTQRQKKLIEEKEKETQLQKDLIEEKQKEILDSIHYAKRIQTSLMPNEKTFERQLKKFLGIIFIFSSLSSVSQTDQIKDLKKELAEAKEDTSRINLSMMIAELEANFEVRFWDSLRKECEARLPKSEDAITSKRYRKYIAMCLNNAGYILKTNGEIPKALEYYQRSLDLHTENEDLALSADLLTRIGEIHFSTGDTYKAINYYLKSAAMSEKCSDTTGLTASYDYLGIVYEETGDISKALEMFHKSLNIRESQKKPRNLSSSYSNLGSIYKIQGDYNKSLEYFKKCLEIDIKGGNKRDIATSYNNLGVIYANLGDDSTALIYYLRSMRTREEMQDMNGMGVIYNNLGSFYSNDKAPDYNQALKWYFKSLEVREKINDRKGLAQAYSNLASTYIRMKDFSNAMKYAPKGLEISKELGFPDRISKSAKILGMIYEHNKDFMKALEMHELFIQMRDSINNQQTRKLSIKKQYQYEYEKKAAADSVRVAQEQQLSNVQLEQEKSQRYVLYGGLALIIAFAGFMVNRFKVMQKQKLRIEEKEREASLQKDIIEEKQKEILDSIKYARRIQSAIITNEKYIEKAISKYKL